MKLEHATQWFDDRANDVSHSLTTGLTELGRSIDQALDKVGDSWGSSSADEDTDKDACTSQPRPIDTSKEVVALERLNSALESLQTNYISPTQKEAAGCCWSRSWMCTGTAGPKEQEAAIRSGEWVRPSSWQDGGSVQQPQSAAAVAVDVDMHERCKEVLRLVREVPRWKVVCSRSGVVVSQSSAPGHKFNMILSTVFVKRVSAKTAISKLVDVKYYPRYISLMEEHIEKGNNVQYVRSKAVWPTKARDFVVRHSWPPRLLDDGGDDGSCIKGSGKGTWGTASTSVVDADFPPGRHPKTTRGHILLAGSIATDQNGPDEIPGCRIWVLQHIDLKGDLPAFLVNKFGAETPLKMLMGMRNFLEEEPEFQ